MTPPDRVGSDPTSQAFQHPLNIFVVSRDSRTVLVRQLFLLLISEVATLAECRERRVAGMFDLSFSDAAPSCCGMLPFANLRAIGSAHAPHAPSFGARRSTDNMNGFARIAQTIESFAATLYRRLGGHI
jgi:hypothetical protein